MPKIAPNQNQKNIYKYFSHKKNDIKNRGLGRVVSNLKKLNI